RSQGTIARSVVITQMTYSGDALNAITGKQFNSGGKFNEVALTASPIHHSGSDGFDGRKSRGYFLFQRDVRSRSSNGSEDIRKLNNDSMLSSGKSNRVFKSFDTK